MKTTKHMMTAIALGLMLLTPLAESARAQLPNPGMTIDRAHTALVLTDPQNDFLSPEGVTWGVVGESVTDNNTVEKAKRK